MGVEESAVISSASASASASSNYFSRFWSAAKRSKPITPASDAAVLRNAGDGLVRRLGLFNLILIGIGASIGAGIFVVTGTVAHDAGPGVTISFIIAGMSCHILIYSLLHPSCFGINPGYLILYTLEAWLGVTISFIIAGMSCVMNALCYAELSSRFPPVVGGAYLYTYSAFNELTAFLVFAQLMFDYHIGAASIARSLASYVVSLLELIPFLKDSFPRWIGHGEEVLGALSINLLAPIILIILTLVLCKGVGESSFLNSIMTVTKVLIVLFVIVVGAFKVDVVNWTPFAPNGFKSILTGATVVFFAYVGFDAVANSAEESKRPQRDLPLGIMASLLVCAALYIAVCLVITGMLPYQHLGEEAPLAQAFTSKGMKYVSVLISFGAVAGLTTTLLVGLYVQSRLYLGLGRDGLLPAIFAKVHPTRHTPIHSQVWVGFVAGILACLLNVHVLSHILSVGSLTGYSVVSACVVTLRWNHTRSGRVSKRKMSGRAEGIIYLLAIAICGFAAGAIFRFTTSFLFMIVPAALAICSVTALALRQVYTAPPGFSCPGVPIVPSISIFFNMFLFAQLHYEGWVRFIALSIVTVGIYAFYGQFHANPVSADGTVVRPDQSQTENS